MKILFVLTYYRPHWTGLTRYAARLAEGLAQKNHQISVLAVQHQKGLPLKETINKVEVHRIPFLFKFSRGFIAPLLFFKFLSLLLKNEVIVIYLPFPEVLPFTLIAKIAKRKIFLVHNGDLVLPQRGGFLNRLLEKFYYLNTSLAIKFANAIIVQTKDYSQHSKLLSSFEKKWKVILPLYPQMKTNLKKIKAFKRKYHLENKKLVGFSGRFVEEKGVDYLLKAIPQVVAKIPQAHFLFAGEYRIAYENFWQKIKNLVKKNKKYITLLGLIRKNDDLATFYSALDVLVVPSRSDCFPSAQVEALLLGTPVVCTDIPGARWLVKTTKMGLLVKSRSSQALARGIIKILKSRKKYLSSQKKLAKLFNSQKTIKKYEVLFSSF